MAEIELTIHDRLDGAEQAWRALQMHRGTSIYQRYEWISAWVKSVGTVQGIRPLVVVGKHRGEPVVVLPLGGRGGPFSKVGWLGGHHVNYTMALFEPQFAARLGATDIRELIERVRVMLPGNGVWMLCCQPREWDGVPNPLAMMPHQRGVHNAYIMELAGGFDRLLADGNAKRKRKKHRSQLRAVAGLGGYRLVVAETKRDVLDILDAFHEQKQHRLADIGVHNVFASPGARQFLRELALSSLGEREPALTLFGLEIGGRIRAVYGGGIKDGCFSAFFNSFANDELAHLSPGELLLYLMVEHFADKGFTVIDMGPGDERYKRSWCQRQIELFDTVLPLSALAWPTAWATRGALAIMRHLRADPFTWGLIRRLRRTRAALRPAVRSRP